MSRLSETIEWIEAFYRDEHNLPDEIEAENTLFSEFISMFEDLESLVNAGELTPTDLGLDIKLVEIPSPDEPAFAYDTVQCSTNISTKLYKYIENIYPEHLV